MANPFDALGASLLGVFGEAVILTPQEGPTRTLRGIFRDAPQTDEFGRVMRTSTRVYTLRVRKSDAAGFEVGATVTVSGTTYAIRSAVSDETRGDTFVVCDLEVAS